MYNREIMSTAIRLSPFQRLVDFYRDREYFRQMSQIGLPIIFQQFIFSLLNMVSVLLIGQKGETAMAAVGLANQVFFLYSLILYGIASGAAIFTAQLWGKQDIPSLRKVLGLCLTLSLAVAIIFLALAQLFPRQILELFSKDTQVVALGSAYLRLFSGSFIFYAITFSYALVLRSTGEVKMPMAVNVTSLCLNILLAYGLIFGKLGLPAMGMVGAAIAVLTSRIVECVALLVVTYASHSPVAARLHELARFDPRFIITVLKPVLPVALNELLWAGGITVYSAVYARISTASIAAMNIVGTVDNLALTLFIGITNATTVLVGNRIGAGEDEEAYRYALRSNGLSAILALLVGGLILILRHPILSLYKVSPEVIQDAYRVLLILALFLFVRAQNLTLIIGAFRSGGDTRYALFLDGVIIWIFAVPLVCLGCLVFHLPVYWVYLLAMSEELTKYLLSLPRFFSRKWIHDLARSVNV
jgi:putative MATE family efflux protein